MTPKAKSNLLFIVIILFIAFATYKISNALIQYKENHKNTKTNTILFRH